MGRIKIQHGILWVNMACCGSTTWCWVKPTNKHGVAWTSNTIKSHVGQWTLAYSWRGVPSLPLQKWLFIQRCMTKVAILPLVTFDCQALRPLDIANSHRNEERFFHFQEGRSPCTQMVRLHELRRCVVDSGLYKTRRVSIKARSG